MNLPDDLAAFVVHRVGEGDYASAEEYIQTVLRDASQADAEARTDVLLLEALSSPEPRIEAGPEYWARKRHILAKHLKARGQR